MDHSPFAAAFTSGLRLVQPGGAPVEMQVLEVGRLVVPTGRIIVADPFITDFEAPPPPLAGTAPTGVHPVELAIARFIDAPVDARVACARLRFGPAEQHAVTWEPARFADDDLEGAYGVDAGMGCFFDAAARGPVDEATAEAWLATAEVHRVDNAWTWLAADVGPANVLMFSSGWGDGFYGSYWGLDANGAVVELVTDFDVLLAPVYERIELPLPLPRGKLTDRRLAVHGVTLVAPLLSRTTVTVRSQGHAGVTVSLSDGSPVAVHDGRSGRRHSWHRPASGVRLVVEITDGHRPLADG